MSAYLSTACQKILDAATSAENGPVGVVYGAVDRDGKKLVEVASGKRDIKKSDAMTLDSVFALWSMTKLVGAIAVMQLVEQGKLKLDEPVGDVLPELAKPQIVDADGKLSPAKNKITLRHLLTHTSGHAYPFFHPNSLKNAEVNGGEGETGGTIGGVNKPLVHEPGTDWNYGVGIDWAGEAVARASGMKLGDYVKKNIFDPLGVRDAAFGLLPQCKDRAVAMHQRDSNGKIGPGDHHPYYSMSPDEVWHASGHGLIGTVDDYLRILTVLINDGKGGNGARILSSESTKEILRDQIEHLTHNPLEKEIPAVIPSLTYPCKLQPGVKKGWSFAGLVSKEKLPTGREAMSCEWAGLANLYWTADPKTGVASVVMSQSLPFGDPKLVMPWLDCETQLYKSLRA